MQKVDIIMLEVSAWTRSGTNKQIGDVKGSTQGVCGLHGFGFGEAMSRSGVSLFRPLQRQGAQAQRPV